MSELYLWFSNIADGWWDWNLSCLTEGMVVYLVAELLLRFGKKLSPQVRYAILCIALLKCVAPSPFVFEIPLLQKQSEIQTVTPVRVSNHSIQPDASPQTYAPPVEPAPVVRWTIPTRNSFLFAFNLLGSLGIGLYLCFAFVRHKRRLKRLDPNSPIAGLCERICARMRLRTPRLLWAADLREASAGGWLRPFIALPYDLLDRDDARIELVLVHELAHLKRRDHLANGLQLLVSTLFWWNPLAARLNHLIRCEREHCCDDLVLRTTGADPRAYSTVLLDAAERQARLRRFGLVSAFASPRRIIQQRIGRITMYNKTDKKYSLWGTLIVFLFILALGFGFQIAGAKSNDDRQMLLDVIEELKTLQQEFSNAYENDADFDRDKVSKFRAALSELKTKAVDSTVYSTSIHVRNNDIDRFADQLGFICLGRNESIHEEFKTLGEDGFVGNEWIGFRPDTYYNEPALYVSSPRKEILDLVHRISGEFNRTPEENFPQKTIDMYRKQWQFLIDVSETGAYWKQIEEIVTFGPMESQILRYYQTGQDGKADALVSQLRRTARNAFIKAKPDKEWPSQYDREFFKTRVFMKATSLAREEMRKMKNALEICFICTNYYPKSIEGPQLNQAGLKFGDEIFRLDSPKLVGNMKEDPTFKLPFLDEYPDDPFSLKGEKYHYFSDGETSYILISTGPDGDFDFDITKYTGESYVDFTDYQYDPANGLMSSGDIIAVGP